MSNRSGGRKASFDILAGDSSGDERSLSLRPNPLRNGFPDAPLTRRKRKSRKRKAAAAAAAAELNGEMPSVLENGHCENFAAIKAESESLRLNGGSELRQRKLNGTVPEEAIGIQFTVLESRSVVETVCENTVVVLEPESLLASSASLGEVGESAGEGSGVTEGSTMRWIPESNGGLTRLETVESLDWKRVCENTVVVPEPESLLASSASLGEVDESAGEGSGVTEGSTMRWIPESNGGLTRLETVESLDWKRVLAENPSLLGGDVSPVYRSPLKYFMGEIYGGSSLRSTISVGNEKKRQRVYNTVFHVPVRCERLIVAGFFVCLDSFLSLLTIMPARIAMTIWRVLTTRQFLRPNAAELSDFGCFVVLASGVTSLQLTDISLIYHIIRGQGILKLYVVYNVLEIFDKLCQSFGEDVLQVLFNSAEGLATCSTDNVKFELLRFIFDQTIAVTAFIVHSFVLLAQAITLSTCIIAHNNALLALLVSNNFAEIKSNVFKRVSKENLHNLVYYDIVERFHISAFVLFVLAQNILEAEGPWFGSFLTNALLVFMCEVFIDMIKHSFLAKFNEIKPIAYSEFLEDLCKQTLNEKPEERGTDLTFIPLAPACVVIRVLTPIYASLLPIGPLPWRLTWIVIWCSLTYVMIAACKIMVGLGLRRLATWYLSQCLKRKQHMD